MKFGITPRAWGGSDFIDEAGSQVKLAESLGYYSMLIDEHHANVTALPSPLMTLAALSQHAPSMALGMDVILLPLYNPVRVAEDVAFLSQITKSKVILGMAVGYREVDFVNFGIPMSERAARMNESLKILRKIFVEDNFSYQGRFFNIKNFNLQPKMAGGQRPEMWIGGWKEAAVRRAARLADYWFPGPVPTYSAVKKCLAIYQSELQRLNKKFNGFPLMREMYVAKKREEALAESRKAITEKYQSASHSYKSSTHPLLSGQLPSDYEELLEDRFIIGSPEDAIEMIDTYAKDGVFHLVLRIQLPHLQSDKVKESLKLFSKEVMPHFKD